MIASSGRQLLQVTDKENVGSQVKTPGKALNPSQTPARRPLARLNQEAPLSAQRPKGLGPAVKRVLSQTIWTPSEGASPAGAAPVGKTPSRKGKSGGRRSKSSSLSLGPAKAATAVSVTEAAESILKEVLLQEITEVSQNVQEEGRTEVEASLRSPAVGDHQLERAVAALVEHSLQTALHELSPEQALTSADHRWDVLSESWSELAEAQTNEGLWSIALGLGDSSPDSPALRPPQIDNGALYAEFGSSDACTPTDRLAGWEDDGSRGLDATADEMGPFSPLEPGSTIETAYGSLGTSLVTEDASASGSLDSEMVHSEEAACLPTGPTETTPMVPPTSKRDGCVMTTPINLAGSATVAAPVHLTDASCGTTPVLLTESWTLTTPAGTADANAGTTPVQPLCMSHKSVGMTPVHLVDSAFGTTPKRSSDANHGTTPIRMAHASAATTPTSVADAGIGTTPFKPAPQLLSKGCMVTPVRTVHLACGTSPLVSAHISVGTTPVRAADVGLGTDPVEVSDSCTGTAPLALSEVAVGTEPHEMADAQCGTTPVRVADSRCGTTPPRAQEVGTAVTPVAVSTVETLTSPLTLPAFKLEAGSPSQLDPAVLRNHLESACISNELLRTEIRTLQADRGRLADQLDGARTQQREVAQRLEQLEQREAAQREKRPEQRGPAQREAAQREKQPVQREAVQREKRPAQREAVQREKRPAQRGPAQREKQPDLRPGPLDPRVELRQTAKTSLQKEVDDLLIQVGEQMNQIGHLQGAVDQKSAQLAAALQEQASLRENYQREISNLQQDLRTSYKQHLQQVAELKSYQEEHDYEPHYKRAVATVAELRAELLAYTDLKETLDRAAQMQSEFGCIEEAYGLVNALFTRTMDKKDEVDAQRAELSGKMDEMETANRRLQDHLAQAEGQTRTLQAALDSALDAEKSALCSRDGLARDVEDAVQMAEEVRMQLEGSQSELLSLREEYQSAQARNEELSKESVEHFLKESSLEAALGVQASQWQETAAKIERLRSSAEQERTALREENARLECETQDLRGRLTTQEDLVSSLGAELEELRKASGLREAEAESLKSELKANREARLEARRLAHQIQCQQQRFKENVDFLEEERSAMVEAAREAEDQLKLSTLELSRLKVALSRSEEASVQWKAAAENLSDKLQFCQSELDSTKAQAHRMLLAQASEIRDASDGLTALLQHIQQVQAGLTPMTKDHGPVGEDASNAESERAPAGPNKAQPETRGRQQERGASGPSGSLVAAVLAAVSGQDEGPVARPETPPLPSGDPPSPPTSPSPSESGPSIGASESSAFAAVRSSGHPRPVTEGRDRRVSVESKELPLSGQVVCVRALFGTVFQAVLARNEGLEACLGNVSDERSQLKGQLQRAQRQQDREACLAREQLRQSELQECRLRREVARSQTALTEQQQSLQYAQQRLQAMADNLARFSDQKTTIEKLQTETAKLNSSLRVVQREKSHLQEQLDSLLSGSSRSSGEGPQGKAAIDGTLVRENLALKKELEKLRVRLVERQEHYESVNTRATRHTRILEDNWHKADAEVYRLDELFGHCKQLIDEVAPSSDEHANMAALRQILR